MSGAYKALYRFEYGAPDAPHALELREYEDEPGYEVTRVPPDGSGCSFAWFKFRDEARDFLVSKVADVIRCDKAADESDRLDGRAE